MELIKIVIDKMKIYIDSQFAMDELFWKLNGRERPLPTLGDSQYYLITDEMLNKLKKLPFLPDKKNESIDYLVYYLTQNDNYKNTLGLYENESRQIFEYIFTQRIAYALFSDLAFNVFPFRFEKNSELTLEQIDDTRFAVNNYIINSRMVEINGTWVNEQYKLKNTIKKGDVVLDIGGFCGETALWFSEQVGYKGQVYCFEPVKANYDTLLENIKVNNAFNVEPINKAVSDETKYVHMKFDLGASKIVELNEDLANASVPCITIDEFVHQNQLKEVDFIKMDIEGAEYNALMGATKTIRSYSPVLAICVYHSLSDFINIPLLIKQLNPSYKLYLSHRSYDFYETVLFATMEK